MILSILAVLILQIGTTFWSYWGDGKAELDRYKTIQSRYGEDRNAEEIFIYVTEPFDLKEQVKTESYVPGNSNQVQVLKFNRIKDFQTGIYDYNLMTSVFTAVDPFVLDDKKYSKGDVIKISFSAHDWCGHVFHQLNRRNNGMHSIRHSYFENESDQEKTLPVKKNTLFADNLFIDVRELFKELPTGNITLYQSLENTRLLHKPMSIGNATITKSISDYNYNNKNVLVTLINITGKNESWKFVVEKQYPKKILFYENSKNNTIISQGKLIKSVRLPYWKLHNPGDEKYLKKLGD